MLPPSHFTALCLDLPMEKLDFCLQHPSHHWGDQRIGSAVLRYYDASWFKQINSYFQSCFQKT